MNRIAFAALAATALAAPLAAQNTTTQSPAVAPVQVLPAPPPPISAEPTQNAVLRAGTPITLSFLEEVTTKKKRARVGQRVRMEVAAPVEVNGVVVIPAGSPAEGEITSVRNKGMWGKSGHIEVRVLFVRVNGRQIRLSGTVDDKGVTGTAGVVAAVALVPVVGFFVTGTSAVIPVGAQFNGFIDEDVPLAMANTGPAPMVVGAPAAPMAVSGDAGVSAALADMEATANEAGEAAPADPEGE